MHAIDVGNCKINYKIAGDREKERGGGEGGGKKKRKMKEDKCEVENDRNIAVGLLGANNGQYI